MVHCPELDARDRRARVATAALFLTNGALFANLLPRYPEIKADLGLTNTAFGLAVAAFSAGALLTGPTAAALIRRFRSAVVAVAGSVLIAVFTLPPGWRPPASPWRRRCSARAPATRSPTSRRTRTGCGVQRAYGRFIINSLHAVWSVGRGAGRPDRRGRDLSRHPACRPAVVHRVCCSAWSAWSAYRFLLPGADHEARPDAPGGRPRAAGRTVYLALAALVGIAIAGAVVEDAGSSWATLYLRDFAVGSGARRRARVRRGGRASSSSAAYWATGWWTASGSVRWPGPAA